MKKICVVITILFFNFGLQAFTFDARISSDQSDVDINGNFTLQIEVQMDDGKDLEIEEIKGLENFEIVSRSQSQASSTSISVINGKAETVSKFINSINFVLKPLHEGDFLLGPVVIVSEDETKETNSLEISVFKDMVLIQTGSDVAEVETISEAPKSENVNTKCVQNKYIFYLLTLGLLVILITALFYIQKERGKHNEDEEDGALGDDFERKELGEICLNIDDKDFASKIEKIFQTRLSKKYGIKNIGEKSYNEILKLFEDDLENRETLKDIIDNINKFKYSNVLVSKAKLLQMIKKFNF